MYGSTEQRSPGLTLVDAVADGDDLDAQLVAGDARVAVERHLAEVAADVGAADADAVDADEGLAGAGGGRLGDGDGAEPAGLFELDGLHRGPCEWGEGCMYGRHTGAATSRSAERAGHAWRDPNDSRQRVRLLGRPGGLPPRIGSHADGVRLADPRADTNSRAEMCVASRMTGGATPASSASFHRSAHRHQRSPGRRPGKPKCGTGVDRSFPRAAEKARNSAVISAQTT